MSHWADEKADKLYAMWIRNDVAVGSITLAVNIANALRKERAAGEHYGELTAYTKRYDEGYADGRSHALEEVAATIRKLKEATP